MAIKGLPVSEESKEKMRQAKLGKEMSDEFKRKRSEIMKQRWADPEFKKEMSLKHTGENNVNYGKPLSEEHKQKLSDAAKNRTDGHIEKLRQMNQGKTASEETKKKMSKARSGRRFTEEHKQKLREAHLTDKNRELHSKCAIKLWDDAERATKLRDVHKKRCEDIEGKERMVALATKRWELQKKNDLDGFWYGAIRYYEGPQYCEKWTTELKERVRAYFGYRCVECGTPQKGVGLHVHHVWYNKRLCCDNTPRSLVPLCSSCHSKTNTNRDYWSKHFQEIIDTYYEGKCWFTKEEAALYL